MFRRMAFQLKPDGSPRRPGVLYRRNQAGHGPPGGEAEYRHWLVDWRGGRPCLGTTAGMDELSYSRRRLQFRRLRRAPGITQKCVLDGRKLVTEPRAYMEQLVVTLAGRWTQQRYFAKKKSHHERDESRGNLHGRRTSARRHLYLW